MKRRRLRDAPSAVEIKRLTYTETLRMPNDYQKRSNLWNEDLAPTDARHRTWRWRHFAALWTGMVMCIPCYILASGLIDQGMSAMQAVGTVLL